MKYDADIRKKALEHIEKHGLAPTHKRIAEVVGHDRKVLDLGCATGYLAEALAANGCRVTGLELDTEAAQQARNVCERVIEADAGDPEMLRKAGSGFDAIVCADILEHLADPWTVMKTLRDLLAPSGELIASVPNIAYWQMRLKLLAGRFEYTETGLLDRTHLRFFTVTSFIRLARDCGFETVDMIVNDAGIPGFPRILDWNKIPGWIRKIVRLWPDMCVFHAIYRLRPGRRD